MQPDASIIRRLAHIEQRPETGEAKSQNDLVFKIYQRTNLQDIPYLLGQYEKNYMIQHQPCLGPAYGRRHFLQLAAGGAAAAAALPGLGLTEITAAEGRTRWQLRLVFSSVMLGELPIEEVCARAAALGFEYLDVWCPFDHCQHLTDVMKRLGPDGFKEVLAKHKLKIGSFTTYKTKWESVGFPAYADFIGKCGGGLVVRESQYRKIKPEELRSEMKGFFERLKPEIDLAAQAKVRLAVENHGGALLNTLDSFKAFVDLNPAPKQVGVGIAPYHLQPIQASVEEAIAISGAQLLFFYAWQKGENTNQFPGIGPADCVPWLKALAKSNYQGCLSPFMHGHPTPEELTSAVAKSRDYLKDCYTKAVAD